MESLQKDVAVPENKQKSNFSIVLQTGKKYIYQHLWLIL